MPKWVKSESRFIDTAKTETNPLSRQMLFHLAVDLIEKINKEADDIAFGNMSGAVSKILEEHFAKKSSHGTSWYIRTLKD